MLVVVAPVLLVAAGATIGEATSDRATIAVTSVAMIVVMNVVTSVATMSAAMIVVTIVAMSDVTIGAMTAATTAAVVMIDATTAAAHREHLASEGQHLQ